MKASSRRPTAGSGREPPSEDRSHRQTPNTDMQDEDAGTADSGNDARAAATPDTTKLPPKTGREGGSKR